MKFNFCETKAKDFLHQHSSLVVKLEQTSKELAELDQYEGLKQSIETQAAKYFERVKVHFFGSRVMGLASEESDMDIFVEIGERFESSFEFGLDQELKFHKLSRSLRLGLDWNINQKLLKTRVPIIIAKYRPLKLNCDISICNGLSVRNSQLIAHLFNIQPRAVPFYHFIRQWMLAQQFNGLKGYTITLLVIFYLQSISLMPPVKVVQQGLPIEMIAGYQAQFDRHRSLESYDTFEMYEEHSRIHVFGFFEFYSRFDFNRVISTYEARSIDVKLYKLRFPLFTLKGIFIAGPLNKGVNCGYVSKYDKERFIELCKASSKFMKKFI